MKTTDVRTDLAAFFAANPVQIFGKDLKMGASKNVQTGEKKRHKARRKYGRNNRKGTLRMAKVKIMYLNIALN